MSRCGLGWRGCRRPDTAPWSFSSATRRLRRISPWRRIACRRRAAGRHWTASCRRRFARVREGADDALAGANRPGPAGGGAMTAAPAPKASILLRQLLPLTIVAIEFSWAYPWVLLLSGSFYGASAAPLLPPGSALVLLTLA